MIKNQRLGVLILCIFANFFGLVAQSYYLDIIISISDEETQAPLQAAYVQAGKKNYTSNEKGKVVISENLSDTDSIFISCLGYASYSTTVGYARKQQPFDVQLSLETEKLQEVIISAAQTAVSANSVSGSLRADAIRKTLGTNFASSLLQIKGVSTIQTGATVAKPVIQGMHSNRVLIVNNGVRQRGQQWGDDHAPELDMNTAENISVLKGADAVRFGSEALGGVILLKSKRLPYGRKSIKGCFSSMYGTSGRRYAISGNADGTLTSLPEVAWRIQGTYINSGDHSTANYLLNNTGMREKDFSLALGYKKEKFGIDAFYSRFDTKIGVLFSSQMGDIDLLKERIALGRPVSVEPFSRKIDVPRQKVVHQLIRAKAFYALPKSGRFSLQLAYQTDDRNEFHARRNNLSHVPSLSLTLHSFQVDLGWKNHYRRYWNSEISAHYGYTNNQNLAGTGVVPIIPNYVEINGGIFAIQKFTREKWGAEAGVRFDMQFSNADGIDAYSKRYGGERRFSTITYNVGVRYNLSEYFHLVSNAGVAWRAPHVHELYSNGLNHASGIYAVGDSTLLSEKSKKWITSLNYSDATIGFSIDGFLQKVTNFIYDEPSLEYMTIVSGTYPVFWYKQTNAFFRGVDADFSWNISHQLKYAATGSIIRANELSTDRYLPYIPPLHTEQSITFTIPAIRKWHNTFIKIKHQFAAKQTRFDPQTDLIGDSPSAYHLFGMEIGGELTRKNNQKISVFIDGKNLLNREYKSYTNRFRYYAHDSGRDIRFTVLWQF